MACAAVVIAAEPHRRAGRSRRDASGVVGRAARAALEAGCEPTVVVIEDPAALPHLPEGVTVLVDEAAVASEASAARVGTDWCVREGADTVLVATASLAMAAAVPEAFVRLGAPAREAVVRGRLGGTPCGLTRIDAQAFPLLPIDGGLAGLWERWPALVGERDLDVGDASPAPEARPGAVAKADAEDVAAVKVLLGRAPAGDFRVVVRDRAGGPVVIENAPFLDDGTPMPTRYWLVGRREREAVGRLESVGGVADAEAAIAEEAIAEAHERYAALRDAAVPVGHEGPRPTGGVGGTRRGVKCLHAHLAWFLAGGDDPVGRYVAHRLDGHLPGPVAAIDCGTNSTRLLVIDRAGAQLERQMTITRLGEGVDEAGHLADAAIERTLAVLRTYRSILDELGVVRVRAVATSAARDADNAEAFFGRAEEILGVRPELLEGEEEGRTAYRGATAGRDPSSGPFLVVDVGGGSTELIAGPPDAEGFPAAVISLDVGCVRVTERFLVTDPPTPDEIDAVRAHVGELVSEAAERLPALRLPPRLIGVAGTVSSLAHLELDLDHYDAEAVHGLVLPRERVESWLAELAGETAAKRRLRLAIEADRVDVIVGGAAVLAEVMAVLGHDALDCSEADILDGLASGLLVEA